MSGPKIVSLETPEYRIDGPSKVTGRARYAADHRREGMLHAAFVRSPHPHARIVRIDTSPARELPGVVLVLTGADVRPARLGRRLQDWPVLAWDRVRMVGDRVALVAAETQELADLGANAIGVEYEPLPAVLDPAEALLPGAPVLHPESAGYAYLGGVRPPVPHPNVQGHRRHAHGDVDAAFAAASRIFEHSFEVPPMFHGHLEPRAALVWFEDGALHVISTNKSPFALRDQLAVTLGMPPDRIVVESEHIGGDFGGKGLSIDEFALAFAARAAGRPVRSVTRYPDDMSAANVRHAATLWVRTGLDAEGRIVAHEARVLLDGGAYAAGKPNVALLPGEALLTLAGYRVPSARVEATSVYTNTVPAGNARAPGQPQNSFAAESHMDMIAREIGMDPLDLRDRNAIRPGDVDVEGEIWEDSSVPQVIERIRSELPWPPRRTPGRGTGVALVTRSSPGGALEASALLTVKPDGRVELFTSVPDQGGGAHTAFQRIIAAELGVRDDVVAVRAAGTATAPFDLGVGGSRVTPVVGGAVREAARRLRERLDADLPGSDIDDQLRRAGGVGMSVTGEFKHPAGVHAVCAYAIEVAVDRETGQIAITDCLLVADVGTVINPVALRGQLVGGFAFGLGPALMEELLIEDGVVVTRNLGDYKLPTVMDIPRVRIALVATEGGGPFGAKSVGELTTPPVAPAIANAIEAAAGVRLRSLPLTAEKICAALDRSRPENAAR